jgi:hypothetical protein
VHCQLSLKHHACRQTVNSSQGREHIYYYRILARLNNPVCEQQTTSIDTQESTNERLKNEHAALQRKYYELSSKYEQCVLQIEHVLASDTNF